MTRLWPFRAKNKFYRFLVQVWMSQEVKILDNVVRVKGPSDDLHVSSM